MVRQGLRRLLKGRAFGVVEARRVIGGRVTHAKLGGRPENAQLASSGTRLQATLH